MRLNLTLRKRLERVEKRQRYRRALPTIVIGIYPEEQPGPIIGYEGDGVRALRKEGEPLKTLQARAVSELPARILQTLYGSARAAPERDHGPSGYRTPAAVPEDASRAVAGVGRVASREELVRMGAIPISPERLI